MTDASRHYTGIPDGHGGVTLVPRKGSDMERVMKRLYPAVTFRDQPMSMQLQTYPGEAMNNLNLPRRPGTRPQPPGRGRSGNGDRRWRGRDNGEDNVVPLDADLLALARNAHGDPTILLQLYQLQNDRNSARGFDARGDDCACTRDQGPLLPLEIGGGIGGALGIASDLVNAGSSAIGAVSELGEEANQDRRYRRRGRDAQLPEDNWTGPRFKPQFEDQEEDDPDGEMVSEQLVGQLPEPDEGMTYVLEQDPTTGEISVLMVPDVDGSDLNTNDRAYVHHTQGRDPLLARLNVLHRNIHRTRDAATVRKTVFRHVPVRQFERLELQPNDAYPGSVDVVLVSPATDMGHTPRGAEDDLDASPQEDDFVKMPQPSGRGGEKEMPRPGFINNDRARYHDSSNAAYQSVQLCSMNRANRAFWSKR